MFCYCNYSGNTKSLSLSEICSMRRMTVTFWTKKVRYINIWVTLPSIQSTSEAQVCW